VDVVDEAAAVKFHHGVLPVLGQTACRGLQKWMILKIYVGRNNPSVGQMLASVRLKGGGKSALPASRAGTYPGPNARTPGPFIIHPEKEGP